ncbi:AraC family transcriptional regulator [Pedobacter hiemivivus]
MAFQKPREVYLEVGFEDLSHFSFVFKKKYGVSPNRLPSNLLIYAKSL